jgi:phosphatidylglycerol:prolipoprotein diacylglycerol transferase
MLLYIRINKLSFWPVVDLIAPYVALAQGFGRIGCFLNGCCYGVKMGDGRFPSQLLSAVLLFIIFGALLIWQNRRRFTGEIFLGYCILYSTKRFAVEFLRGDNPKILLGLTMSQLISVAVFAAALAVFTVRAKQWKKRLTISK